MAGSVIIAGLTVNAVIGVYAFEQAIKQPLILDISFAVDIDQAASRDSLADTTDYAAVCASIQAFVDATPCRLLETFTKRLALHLQQTFQLTDLSIKVTKKPKDLPMVGGISISYTDNC